MVVNNKSRKQKICVACENTKTKSNKQVKIHKDAKWVRELNKMNGRIGAPIHTEKYIFLKNNGFPETIPDNSDMKVIVPTFSSKSKIYYFSSESMSLLDASKGHLSTAEKAYGEYTNAGVAIKKGNKFIIHLRSPQPYVSEGILYTRHLHYFFVDEPSKLYTASCIPDHETVLPTFQTDKCTDIPSAFLCFERTMMGKHEGALCINALKHGDGDVFKNDFHIPNVASLDKIKAELKGVDRHKAIIVYCYKKECNAAALLMKKLTLLGYNNLFYFPGGVLERNEKIESICF
jgi:rhodanese-related sulfurtransferase